VEGSGGDRRPAAAPPAASEAERLLPTCHGGDRTHEQESAGRRAVEAVLLRDGTSGIPGDDVNRFQAAGQGE
jgi:hypothetical protein